MKKYAICLLFIACAPQIMAQTQLDLTNIQPYQDFDNVLIKSITDDSLTSSFVIWIKKEVKPHFHEHHIEQVYVLEGTGTMIIDKTRLNIKPGQFFIIPKLSVHSVKVTSAKPLKVLSIQAPHFDGTDRIFVE
ncbi:cupin domain-containing protein [Fulvivirgaceae bacterium BMA10]|uniref:Cupin domain-containing protein n=1 Tax=Splendidivirga corallicola TaxID=3051826 RepID=A0ABT8KSN3_9BACT|nr:cupin domain-containing protein [Fulvivirgaceae bacterium BMA10]